MAHCITLSSLANYFLSIKRCYRGAFHFLEPGGIIFISLGVLLFFGDAYSLRIDQYTYQFAWIDHLSKSWEQRVLADLVIMF